ncbi:hypothetical protein AN960_10375 [Bacillus sp. FJAT-25509]|uniref:hypothetical protein n=1 Tax=Bacillaceae TaxID=186817 RepID=UPI0006F497B6|nr:hypothetical protein [Bacillus sp. FJAT-25509]KQL39354.1 hypothetical protein AN960_10375 [Bacillus sp. FJAT-25509]
MLSSKYYLTNFLLSISFVLAFLVTAFILNDTLRSSHFAGAFGGGVALFLYGIFRKNTSTKK